MHSCSEASSQTKNSLLSVFGPSRSVQNVVTAGTYQMLPGCCLLCSRSLPNSLGSLTCPKTSGAGWEDNIGLEQQRAKACGVPCIPTSKDTKPAFYSSWTRLMKEFACFLIHILPAANDIAVHQQRYIQRKGLQHHRYIETK